MKQNEKFIVKVQTSILSMHSVHRRVFVYNQDKSVLLETDVPENLRWMEPGSKRYFWAHLDATRMLHLDDEASPQDW